MDRRQIGIGLGFAAALISGVSVWVNAMALKAFGDAVLYTTVKNLIAAALLIVIAAALSTRASPHGLRRPRGWGQLLGLAFVSVIGGGVAFVLFFEGLARTTAATAGFIQKTLVIWVAILAITFLRERLGRTHVAAIALLVTGQLVASGGAVVPAPGTGESLILAATLLWAIEVVIAKWLLAGLSPLTVASARMGIGSIALVAFSLASGHWALLGTLSGSQWAWVALTGLILTAYVATWLSALARAHATDVTAALVCGAIVTAVLNAGAQPAALAPSAVGLVLITLGGVALATFASRSPAHPRRTAA
ncbi:MAG: DMT family transporter [Chloroflexota bacterium]|nr:DMT family transporter [Chloroflexota bacterium]